MAGAGTVLVCDDQQENLDLVVASLRPLGYEVLQALNGSTAIELSRIRTPSVAAICIGTSVSAC